MDAIPFRPEERPTDDWPRSRLAEPATWPCVRNLTIEPDERGGLRARYDTDLARAINPLLQRDVRGRWLLEAFTALRLRPDPPAVGVPDEDDLRAFVTTFGAFRDWDDGDRLGLIGGAVVEVRHLVSVADALARGDQAALRQYGEQDRFFLGLASLGEWDSPEPARRFLSVYLSQARFMPEVGVRVDSRGRFGRVLQAESLLTFVYWQLTEQLTKRPSRGDDPKRPDPIFRMPWCGYCGGAILSTRLADDRVNKWHAGCKAAGQAQARRRRAERKG